MPQPFLDASNRRDDQNLHLKRALIGFAALVIAGTAISLGINGWQAYEAEVERAMRANAGIAHTLEEQTVRTVQSINLELSGLADFLRLRPDFEKPGNPEIFDLLRRRRFMVPELTSIIVVDRRGMLVYHSDVPDVQPIDLSDRSYFSAHRDDPTLGLRIVEPFFGRVQGRWLLGMSRALTDAQGRFAGVVVGTVAPSNFGQYYPMLRPRENGLIELLLRDGTCIESDPERANCVGGPLRDDVLIRHYLPSAPVGTYMAPDASGRARITAYRATLDQPFVIVVSSSLESVVASWRQGLMKRGVVALAIAVMVVLFTYTLLRQVSQRIASEAAMAELTRELERKSGQLEVALANMDQGLCMYDADQRLILCNRRYLELYRLPPDLIRPGITLREIMEISVRIGNYRAEDASEIVEGRVATGSSATPLAFRQRLMSGRTIEAVHRPLASGGSVATHTDITDQEAVTDDMRAAKEQAEIANRAKSEFLANMSHELRTPLNAIIGFSQIMTEQMFGPVGNARYKEYAGDILQSSQHLLQIINDILDMAKIEAGRVELNETEIDMPRAAESCLRLMHERGEQAGLKLSHDIAGDLPALIGDERLVRQILLNLLSNAVKFTPKGGEIVVRGEIDRDGAWVLSVRDTGIGIAPENIPKVMVPFGQVDGTYTRAHGGTGLGLSIVRALVELHGARFRLESALGEGTTAFVVFPASRVAPQPAVKAAG
jgi:signal transduction histidine kinase